MENPEKELYEVDKAIAEIEPVIFYCERTGGVWGSVSVDALRKALTALMHEVESIRKEIEP